ncbi:hypothetical protein JRO89_XS13G0169400 [Xanthoceras sorbifolium]|uniref:Glutathione S-transferase n=1 Tax=Xanthoceras sorbifolium TaxID=99658 RepID=A0ABQ8H8T7_9ROSI|nr:hypothetical protein JRO89_XS13G0169400 [Xanthoceras sorbifolium]
MEEENEVKLHGMWVSTYSKRVELALRVKGIPYEYIEEDLSNKSPLLLQYNPVHKKVPVLVHNGKPLAESGIILEYIDETWNYAPLLLPEDPYQRAQIRFWANFIDHQMFEAVAKVLTTDGEAQKTAIEEAYENMEAIEKGMEQLFPDGARKIDGQNLGLLDIMVSAVLGTQRANEQVQGVKIVDPERFPLMFSWVEQLNELPVVKGVFPPHAKVVAFLQFIRKNALKPSSS